MEALGIVLGVVPLAVQLFQSTVSLCSLYSESQDLGKSSLKYQTLIQIERFRYELWGKYTGLDKGAPTPQFQQFLDANLDLVLDILAHIAEALLEARKLGQKKKYRINFPTRTTKHKLDLPSAVDKRRESHAKLAEEVQSRVNLASSIKFAVWDKSKYEALATDLKNFNNGLERISGNYQNQLQNKLLLKMVGVESAQDLSSLSSATETIYPTMSEMAKRKATFLELRERQLHERTNRLNPIDEDPELKLDFSDIKLQKGGGNSGREFGAYRGGTTVMIEWKILSPDIPQNQSLCRIRDLAKFLSKDNASKDRDLSHLPGCLGYCRKSLPGQVDRVALIYETSQATHRTLNELLTDDKNENFSLGTRLRLALSLAECIFFLHVTGWLHKSIRSDNVIVSGDTRNSKNDMDTKALKLQLAGFNAARLDGVGEISEKVEEAGTDDLYQHPDYQNSNKDETGYTRQYDIYSLGLVLLELGIWETIKDKGNYNPKKHNPKRFLNNLLNKGPVASLSFTMGNSYKRAVVWCLEGQFEKDDSVSLTDSEKSMMFWENVVLELSKCSVEE